MHLLSLNAGTSPQRQSWVRPCCTQSLTHDATHQVNVFSRAETTGNLGALNPQFYPGRHPRDSHKTDEKLLGTPSPNTVISHQLVLKLLIAVKMHNNLQICYSYITTKFSGAKPPDPHTGEGL